MTVLIHLEVADYAQYKTAFDASIELRAQIGITSTTLYQSQTNPREVFIVSEYVKPEGTEDVNVTEVMTEAMKNSGAVRQPDIWFLNKV
jgi:hypothetical protein